MLRISRTELTRTELTRTGRSPLMLIANVSRWIPRRYFAGTGRERAVLTF
jgi:hypothetical protein